MNNLYKENIREQVRSYFRVEIDDDQLDALSDSIWHDEKLAHDNDERFADQDWIEYSLPRFAYR